MTLHLTLQVLDAFSFIPLGVPHSFWDVLTPVFFELELIMTELAKYFDLHTTGLGYLNRIRLVQPKKGEAFFACSIAALRGDVNDVEYTYFDCRVSGKAAQAAVECFKADIDANRKVLIGFKIGDIYPETYPITTGERTGQTGVAIKGRLLQVTHAKVDGNPVDLPEMLGALANAA